MTQDVGGETVLNNRGISEVDRVRFFQTASTQQIVGQQDHRAPEQRPETLEEGFLCLHVRET